jgi:methylmalonyl-CoA mutase cobalamin-binding domain/chain
MKNQIRELIKYAEKDKAVELLIIEINNTSIQTVIESVLDPILQDLGKEWENNQPNSFAESYIASKIIEDLFDKYIENNSDFNIESKGTIVFGNIEDDFHSIGKNIVISLLKTKGWKIIDLGNDVLAEEFVDEAIKHNASLIGISAMMHSTALNIKKVCDELEKRGLRNKIKVAAGGSIFTVDSDLVNEVTADGTAKNALLADKLFEKLLKEINE